MSPEMQAMLKEQERYNQQINLMLDVVTVLVTKDEQGRVLLPLGAPIFSGGDDE
jgi:hypothetical protein